MKKLVFLLVFSVCVAGMVYAQSGNVGSISWTLVSGVLVVDGTGDIPDNFSDTPYLVDLKNVFTSIEIREGISGIGNFAFQGCKSVNSVSIPTTVKKIGEQAFEYCTGLSSIDIPNSVEIIFNHAFMFCSNISSLNIPASVTYIGVHVFAGCYSLTSITADAGNPAYTSLDGVLFSKDMTTIVACPGGKEGSYFIPESVKTIDYSAFSYCKKLTSVIIPESVAFIGVSAFTNCESMISIIIPPKVTSIPYNTFNYCINMISVTIPASVAVIGESAFGLCNSLSEIINYNPEPQFIEQNAFDEEIFTSCKLFVPAEAENAYRNAEVWSEFMQIIALNTYITIEFNKNEIYMLNGATTQILATVTGSETVEWKSSHPEVATVYDGVTITGGDSGGTMITAVIGMVTAKTPGTTVITASSGSTEATCPVTVIQPGNSVIEGTVNNPGTNDLRVNLYKKFP